MQFAGVVRFLSLKTGGVEPLGLGIRPFCPKLTRRSRYARSSTMKNYTQVYVKNSFEAAATYCKAFGAEITREFNTKHQ